MNNSSYRANLAATSRRDFLRAGSLSLLGISLQQYLRAAATEALLSSKPGKAQACILLWLEGGPSHIDTWDPKPSSGFKPISTNVAGIQISEILPKVAKHMDKLAIVRSLHTEENNHPQATHYALTGHSPNPAMKIPSFGSIISRETGIRSNFPPHLVTPETENDTQFIDSLASSFAGAEWSPMVLPDPGDPNFAVPDLALPKYITQQRIQNRRSFLDVVDQMYRQKVDAAEAAKMDKFSEQALKMLLTSSVREAFDLSKESAKTKEAYRTDSFGQSVLLARRLVEAGARFVTACGYPRAAWDTHGDNDKQHREKLGPTFDQTFSTLLEDLQQRGLLESTVVIAMGEFGRGPDVNPNRGRDHWPHCWSIVLGGGGIRGGQVVGASDEKGGYVADRLVTMGDIYATVYKAFGIDWEKTYMSPIGRPVKIANSIEDKTGVPLPELVA
jgi:uncharacterized protein (DUF1501 family)